ncbi:DUF4307 domain-containing protein [Janibacter sp. GXQ6167]|uniref:DUF4307 domain-containing protein n=1 Tax=Janibacter sp. GXQ6167 TaxID=3240791 RepID=UPI003524BDE6
MNTESTTTGQSNRFWWIVGTLGVGVAVAITVWFGLASTQDVITWQDRRFERHAEYTTLEFEVTRPKGVEVTCTARALDATYGPVGSVDVKIPASERDTEIATVRIQTTTEAATAAIKECLKTP